MFTSVYSHLNSMHFGRFCFHLSVDPKMPKIIMVLPKISHVVWSQCGDAGCFSLFSNVHSLQFFKLLADFCETKENNTGIKVMAKVSTMKVYLICLIMKKKQKMFKCCWEYACIIDIRKFWFWKLSEIMFPRFSLSNSKYSK